MDQNITILKDSKKMSSLFRGLKVNFYRYISSNYKNSEEINDLRKQLSVDSTCNRNFILCSVASCLIATFGLLSNSAAVIIGAMLVAPLMLPIRGIAFSACDGNFKLFRTAFFTLLIATIFAPLFASFITIISSFTELGSEITARTQPNLIDLGIAVVAGAISAFGLITFELRDTLAGTAIAVALMPPLCVVGISLSIGNYPFALGALLLYLTNLLGIILACMVTFSVSGYTKLNRTFGWAGLLTLILVIPLGGSFFRLVKQQQIESEVKNRLFCTISNISRNIETVNVKIIWTTKIPTIYLTLQTDQKITPKQVEFTEKYINGRFQQNFQLVLLLSPLTQITGTTTRQNTLPKVNYNILDKNFNCQEQSP